MIKLDEIEAAARAAMRGEFEIKIKAKSGHDVMALHIANTCPETILALCTDLRACGEAFDYIFNAWPWSEMSTSGFAAALVENKKAAEDALQNLKKWGL